MGKSIFILSQAKHCKTLVHKKANGAKELRISIVLAGKKFLTKMISVKQAEIQVLFSSLRHGNPNVKVCI
ncbi:MAG: hypothetical protein LBD84_07510 [Campylobacteraceae bacterium]|jgi:hypothetical protein|nr:hypothetical protein [Campylobacteraceae bacterium]